jgi:hypothetical protein
MTIHLRILSSLTGLFYKEHNGPYHNRTQSGCQGRSPPEASTGVCKSRGHRNGSVGKRAMACATGADVRDGTWQQTCSRLAVMQRDLDKGFIAQLIDPIAKALFHFVLHDAPFDLRTNLGERALVTFGDGFDLHDV